METTIILLIIIILPIIFYLVKNQKKQVKSPHIKKQEIIDNYSEEMKEILCNESYNPEIRTREKIKLMKKINYELSMNLFFTEEESKEVLELLAKMK